MEINSTQNNILYPTKNERIPEQTQPLQNTAEKEDAKPQDHYPLPQDEYISGESAAKKPSGLYQIARDDNGNRQIIYDDPNKKKVQTSPADSSSGKAEECTTNTDKVDREIEKLKEEKKKLEQQLRSTSEDEAGKKQLEQKLAMIENELLQKDNDTYRRQNSTVQGG